MLIRILVQIEGNKWSVIIRDSRAFWPIDEGLEAMVYAMKALTKGLGGSIELGIGATREMLDQAQALIAARDRIAMESRENEL